MRKTATYSLKLTLLAVFAIMQLQIVMAKPGHQVESVKDVFIDLSLNNASLTETFARVEAKTSFKFHYSESNIKTETRFSKKYKKTSVADILTDIAKESSLKFKQVNNVISVNKVTKAEPEEESLEIEMAGDPVTITVVDENGNPLIGVNVSIKGTSQGGTTGVDGTVTINATNGATLMISYIGYVTEEITYGGKSSITVTMQPDVARLDDIVIVGSRNAPRSSTDTPLPVDMLGSEELVSTGQPTFDKALQYRVPSFNTVQTPVNDATSLLDPYEIRNMGPSRTLILINGKRKNLSALLYTQTSPGRGETGADISGIPTDAIKRVEILRDGASAQYGSDAIAGVMNIVLKDDASIGRATLRTGITSEGDGEMIGFAVNNGSQLGENGFLNYTIDLSKVNLANRPGTVDPVGDAADFGADIEEVEEFLALMPDAGNINGSPETTAAKFLVNGGVDLSEQTDLYFNAAYVYKKVNSFANYRTPYWRTLDDYPYLSNFYPNGPNGEYVGYRPTFDGNLNDYNATLGFKTNKNGWMADLSITTGGNKQTYNVRNTHNGNSVLSDPIYYGDLNGNGQVDADEIEPGVELYRENSRISFDPGGTMFSHVVGNIDISKSITDKLGLGFGSEFRTETFTVIEGELASYDGGGSDSFAGNTPENSGKFNRYNFGGYVDLMWDITPDFLINGTARVENYSDFGNAFVWKVSSRYKFLDDKITLRGSISTGFRAPTLHQIYTQKAQYSFVPGQGIQVGGLINNVSPQARLLGVPELDAEKSDNFTIGLGVKPSSNFDITVDYYNIAMEDRIILSTEIGPTADGDTPLDQVLQENNLSDVSFFVNALDTRTSGIDVVANYKNLSLGSGDLSFSLSGNYTIENERDGAVNNPTLVEDANQSVVNDTQEALFFTSRPKTKWILGINYDINRFGFGIYNTYFGKTTFHQQGLPDGLDTEFDPKIVTDISINYNATEKLSVAFNVNNVLNILPEWHFVAGSTEIDADDPSLRTERNLITFNQRYSQMTYDGSHFSQLGTMFNLAISYKF
ncbi:TonB-dependent receptor [Fulvivirga maritima]|uniref:TonB-dependent receptor n=1 Tax=Fulvivirga maritima TaxID=2904247 RepID=UPI001F31EF8C|nr:TonB-dependent receptor [Fulvivirga maritima]UII26531.1 TonB-dependent receptor [Fulvivirga maritima]